MKPAKIVHFQLWQDAIYVLDADGGLWKTDDMRDASGWKAIPVPTHRQHDIEDAAEVERERRYDISDRTI